MTEQLAPGITVVPTSSAHTQTAVKRQKESAMPSERRLASTMA